MTHVKSFFVLKVLAFLFHVQIHIKRNVLLNFKAFIPVLFRFMNAEKIIVSWTILLLYVILLSIISKLRSELGFKNEGV